MEWSCKAYPLHRRNEMSGGKPRTLEGVYPEVASLITAYSWLLKRDSEFRSGSKGQFSRVKQIHIFVLVSRSRRPRYHEHNVLTPAQINAALDELWRKMCNFYGILVLASTTSFFFAGAHRRQYRSTYVHRHGIPTGSELRQSRTSR